MRRLVLILAVVPVLLVLKILVLVLLFGVDQTGRGNIDSKLGASRHAPAKY
jgi:hypothetical protein